MTKPLSPPTDSFWCVVPAAGRGSRFGSELPKQYAPFHGRPLLLATLRRLAAAPQVAGLLVVLAPDDGRWPGVETIGGKPVLTATGADTREGSVRAGLQALPETVGARDFVLVHDGARPCVPLADIARLVEAAVPAGGGLLATPLNDTLKRVNAEGQVEATEPRQDRWRALTPQMFRRGELADALAAADACSVPVSDESAAMELAGHRPLLVRGSSRNLKVTGPQDLALAEALWRLDPV